MAVIRSGAGTDDLTIDPVSKAARVTLYNSNGSEESALSVSGNVTVINFPATQPVSVATLPLPSGASTETTLALIKAKTDNLDVLLSTRTKPADSQHVTVDNPSTSVSVSNFPVSTEISNDAGNPVPVNGSISISNFPATQPVSGPLTDTQLRATAVATTATDILTKGLQGATGFSVQSLLDAGRTLKSFVANLISGVTAEAMATLTPQTDGTNGSPTTSFSITAGKRLRLQQICVSTRATAAAVARSTFYIRCSASGAVTTTSPIVAVCEVTGPSATALTGGQLAISLPNCVELSGTMQLGISHIASVNTVLENISLIGFEY